jgi:hypothetical protein
VCYYRTSFDGGSLIVENLDAKAVDFFDMLLNLMKVDEG